MKCLPEVCQLAHGRAQFYTRQRDTRSCLPPVRRRSELGTGCDHLPVLGKGEREQSLPGWAPWLTLFQPFGPREVYSRGTSSSPSRGKERTPPLEGNRSSVDFPVPPAKSRCVTLGTHHSLEANKFCLLH